MASLIPGKAAGETSVDGNWLFGLIYWKNGDKDKAEYSFDETIIISNRLIDLGRAYSPIEIYGDLAAVYAFRGGKDKAYEYLRIADQNPRPRLWLVTWIKNDPSFDSIRNEPEFQKILRNMEAKYQAEHERVRKWLEENGKH